jgi:hypothetical protein
MTRSVTFFNMESPLVCAALFKCETNALAMSSNIALCTATFSAKEKRDRLC